MPSKSGIQWSVASARLGWSRNCLYAQLALAANSDCAAVQALLFSSSHLVVVCWMQSKYAEQNNPAYWKHTEYGK